MALPAGTTAAAGYQTQLSIDGAAWRTSPAATTISANGVHSVATRLIKSNVPVAGSDAELIIKVDKTSPTTSQVRTPAATGTPRNPVDVVLSAADATSGVATIEYQVNGGAWTVAGGTPLRFNTVGNYTVSFRAIDKAGNVATVKSTTVKITADPPTSIAASSGGKITAGTPATFTLKGYTRFDTVTIKAGAMTWTTVLTDVNGTAKVTYIVPVDQPKGALVVTATGTGPGPLTASTTLTIK